LAEQSAGINVPQTADWRNAEIRRNRAGRSLCGGGEQLVKFFFVFFKIKTPIRCDIFFFYFSISFENYFVVVGFQAVNSFQPRDLNSQNKEKQKGRRQIKKILSAARRRREI
jgi:hypothetical protein